MKRKIMSLVLAAVVAGGVATATPAVAASNGGYLICAANKLVAAEASVKGVWHMSVPGKPYLEGHTTRFTIKYGYGTSRVGYWSVSATQLSTNKGYCR